MATVVTLKETALGPGLTWEARPGVGDMLQVISLEHTGPVEVYSSSDLANPIYAAAAATVIALPAVLDHDDYWVVLNPGPGTISVKVRGASEIVGLVDGRVAPAEAAVTLAVNFGSGAGTVCQGNDARLSNSRPPTGGAGGDLTGSYPNPDLKPSGVVAGTYGGVSGAKVPWAVLDAKGRVVSAGERSMTPADIGAAEAAATAAALAGKAAAVHTHAQADVTNLTTDLAGKAATNQKLDDFGAPDDNTDLNASSTAHGLCPKLSNDADHVFKGTGSFGIVTCKSYATADLPAAASNARAVVWCSDCLTPSGTGGLVFSDGSAWRLVDSSIVATTDPLTWYVSAIGLGRSFEGTNSVVRVASATDTAAGGRVFSGSNIQGGAAVGPSGPEDSPAIGNTALVLGTTSNNTAAGKYLNVAGPSQLNTYLSWFFYVDINISSASVAGTEYLIRAGGDNLGYAFTLLPTTCAAEFIYDPQNGLGKGVSNSNWWVMSMAAGVTTGTVEDTGVAVSAGTYNRLGILWTGSSLLYYIDGVLKNTHTSNLPSTTAYIPQIGIYRHTSVTTTSRYARLRTQAVCARWLTARTIW